MQGNDHMRAAESDWVKQLKEQSNAIYYTIMEMGDPTLEEAHENLEAAIKSYIDAHDA